MGITGWSAPSEEDLEKGSDYDTLPEDEYLAKIVNIEVKTDQPNKFPSKSDAAPTHDMLVVKMEAITFANGDTLVDIDDEELDGTVPFQVWLNPKKVGMIPQPSKTRKFFAAALGQALGDPITITDFNELIGKTVIVSLKPNNSYNNAQDFRKAARKGRATTSKGPVDAGDLVKRAKEVFDEDSPTNTSPNPAATAEDDLDF